MAARKTVNTEASRQKIKCSQLVNMLNCVALTGKYRGKEVGSDRIRAAQVLLSKTLPDLKATDHTGTVSHTFPGVHFHPPK